MPASGSRGQCPGPRWRRGTGRWLAAAVVAVVAVVVATIVLLQSGGSHRGRIQAGPPPAGRRPTAGLPRGPLVPSQGALFGAYAQPDSGYTYIDFENAILALEHGIGRKLAVDNLYAPWLQPMPFQIARWDLAHGTIPMISWAGVSTRQIIAGVYDRRFRAVASQMKSMPGPVLLRWFYEMDGSVDRPLIASPASFVAAWRHVHRLFAAAGATNVSWVWCPNALHFFDGIAQKYYPGGQYVDWGCADGYNWAPEIRNAPWKSFGDIFSAFYRWGVAARKPLMIGEFGALERKPREKAAWIAQTARQLRTEFPAIRAVVYFNSDHDGFDWRVTTSASALGAFKSFASVPYFRAQPKV